MCRKPCQINALQYFCANETAGTHKRKKERKRPPQVSVCLTRLNNQKISDI
jgi:hypothetical protein